MLVRPKTKQLWDKQNQHPGDRWRLFRAIGEAVPAQTVLYPGSYVDVAASFIFPDVTYADIDRRAAAFFDDDEGVREVIAAHNTSPASGVFRFIHSDYSSLSLPRQQFDLLVSLYAGFVSEHCTEFLKIGGALLVNPSHGDAALASIDPRYELAGVIISRSGDYRVSNKDLSRYLVTKKPLTVTRDLLFETCRGIGYTHSPFAYLFRRTS